MRKLIILSFITMDGVMQAPGAPTEDTSGIVDSTAFPGRTAG
jgi:hypothetical protein